MSVRSRRSASVRLLAALAALAASLPLAVTAQPSVARPAARGPHYAVAAWSTEHGLPSSIVNVVAQAPDGYLWLATYEGLVRFDGVTFRTFGDGDIPGLERGSFVTLLVQPDPSGDPARGTLWAGSESGELVRYRDGQWRVFTADDGLPGVSINSLALDRAGGLWIGSRLGVWRLTGEHAAPFAWPDGRPQPAVAALAADARGTLWIGTVADGLLRLHGDSITRLTTRDGLASDRIDALLTDPDGTLWAGAYGATGVARVRDGRIEHFGTRLARPGAVTADTAGAPRRARFLLRDRAGTLWLAAENGLFALRGAEPHEAELVPLGEPGAVGPGLGAGRVKAETLCEDSEGNLWVGTRQSGVFRLRAASFATLGPDDGLPNPFVFAVHGDGAGGAWVATQDGAAHLPANGPAQRAPVLGDHQVRDVLRTADGDVWLATTSGLTRLQDGRMDRVVTYTRRDGLSDDRVRALAAGRGGAVWAATFNGVSEWRDGRLRRYGPAEGLPDGYVLSVFEDAAGTLWIGTQTAGLFRCPTSAGAPTAARRCAPASPALARQPIFRLTETADGTLWAGTARGLARIRRRAPDGPVAAVALLRPRHGLPGRTIFQALDDGQGALWLTGPWGIGRAERAALDSVADAIEAGRTARLEVTPFGRGDGMAAREASSISRAWRAPDGTLWFPTPLGVAVVDPAHLPGRSAAPRAQIEQVLADGVPIETGPPATLRPGTRALELRVTAPSFTAPERVRLRWRLAPFDRDWVMGGTRREAYYTNLPPDSYRFEVQARVGDGPWGPVAVTTLRLAPYLWQRPGVLAGALLALVGLGAAAYRWRTRVLLRAATERARQAAREDALRAASLRDELTGLYNRRGLHALAEQEIREAQRTGRGFTLLFADLDGLKAINDTLGHAAGDAAIADAAAVVRATFRESDVAARLGGDEFVVLLRDGASHDQHASGEPDVLIAARERLANALARHNTTAERPYTVAMSMGASRFDPAAPRSIAALLADADRRMYGVKRARRATRDMPAVPG